MISNFVVFCNDKFVGTSLAYIMTVGFVILLCFKVWRGEKLETLVTDGFRI